MARSPRGRCSAPTRQMWLMLELPALMLKCRSSRHLSVHSCRDRQVVVLLSRACANVCVIWQVRRMISMDGRRIGHIVGGRLGPCAC